MPPLNAMPTTVVKTPALPFCPPVDTPTAWHSEVQGSDCKNKSSAPEQNRALKLHLLTCLHQHTLPFPLLESIYPGFSFTAGALSSAMICVGGVNRTTDLKKKKKRPNE